MNQGFLFSSSADSFIDLLTALNALSFYGHKEPAAVFDLGLKKEQRNFLEGVVKVLDVPEERKKEKGWDKQIKPYVLTHSPFSQTVHLECGLLPTSNLQDLFASAADGLIAGVKEGEGVFYDSRQRKYGFAEDFFNQKYLSLSLLSIDVERYGPVLQRWLECCDGVGLCDDSPKWPEFEQDMFNVIFCSTPGTYEKIVPLDYSIWSNRHSFLSNLPVVVEHRTIQMANQSGEVQRALYCDLQPDRLEMLRRNGVLDSAFVSIWFLFHGPFTPPSSLIPERLHVFHLKHLAQIDVLNTKVPTTPEEAMTTSSLSDDVVVVLNDLKAEFREGVIVLKVEELFRALEMLKKMKYSDAYIFGLDASKSDLDDIHRLTVLMNDLGKKKRKVHVCFDGEVPLEWKSFFNSISHISTSEGLKQIT